MSREEPVVATFSIVGRDPDTGEMGVAVASKFLAVGSVVSWAAAGAGGIATQSWANTAYGPAGLTLLAEGLTAQQVLERLLADDPGFAQRQVGIVDRNGGSVTYTGRDCLPWAGGIAEANVAAQGNILVSEATVQAMVETFKSTGGDLAGRLLSALDAGQNAGGDSRGRQAAALYVAKEKGGYGGLNDRYIDLRVDDHAEPVGELKRLLDLWRLYFEKPSPESMLELAGPVGAEVRDHLQRLGYLTDGGELTEAWARFVGTENFEERDVRPGYIDPAILTWLRSRA